MYVWDKPRTRPRTAELFFFLWFTFTAAAAAVTIYSFGRQHNNDAEDRRLIHDDRHCALPSLIMSCGVVQNFMIKVILLQDIFIRRCCLGNGDLTEFSRAVIVIVYISIP